MIAAADAFEPGHGEFNLGAVLNPEFVGGQAELNARLNAALSVAGLGYVGYRPAEQLLDWGAQLALRYRW